MREGRTSAERGPWEGKRYPYLCRCRYGRWPRGDGAQWEYSAVCVLYIQGGRRLGSHIARAGGVVDLDLPVAAYDNSLMFSVLTKARSITSSGPRNGRRAYILGIDAVCHSAEVIPTCSAAKPGLRDASRSPHGLAFDWLVRVLCSFRYPRLARARQSYPRRDRTRSRV